MSNLLHGNVSTGVNAGLGAGVPGTTTVIKEQTILLDPSVTAYSGATTTAPIIRRRNSSSSLSSDDQVRSRADVSHKSRAADKLTAAVGQYLLKNQSAGGVQGAASTDASGKAALMAIAQNLFQSKYSAHKNSKYNASEVENESSSKLYKNKALVQSTALLVLPYIREQVKTLSGGKEITMDANGNPKLDTQTIKAIAAVTKKLIKRQSATGAVSTGAGHAGTTTSTIVSGATTTGATTTGTTATGAKSGLSAKTSAAGSIARKLLKKRRSTEKSVSSSSSSSSSDGGKGKKIVLLAAGAAIARGVVTRLNRKNARKEVKAQILVEKEPTKLDALKARLANLRHRSPSSSPDDVESTHKRAGLLAAATSVAKRLTEARLTQRKSNLTEEQYNTKYAAIPSKLQRTESVSSSSDEEVGASKKNKALMTAAKFFVQRQIKNRFKKDHGAASTTAGTTAGNTATVTTITTVVPDVEKRRKREAALSSAAALSSRYFLTKTNTHKSQQRSVRAAQPGEIQASKASELRHRSSSSSSASSSSAEEDIGGHNHNTSVKVAGAGIAKKLVEKLNRRQARGQLKTQIATEKDTSKLDLLKAKLAAFRSGSPDASDSSSSDEESHKKRNLLLASAAATAGLLLKQRLDARKEKGLISEAAYAEKLNAIPSQLAVGTLESGVVGTGISSTAVNTGVTGLKTAPAILSSDDEAIVGKQGKSVILPAQQMVNKLVGKYYRKQYPRKYRRNQTYGTAESGASVEKQRPRAWVKAAQGVALSLLRESANRQRYTKEASATTGQAVTTGQTAAQSVSGITASSVGLGANVGAGLGAGLGTSLGAGVGAGTTSYTTTGTTSYSTTGATTGATTSYSTSVPATTGATTSYSTGVPATTGLGARQYEMVDAAVKVKKHGLTNLVYEDLGYFVTLKLDYDYLHSRGVLKQGDKLKSLLKLKGPKQLALDNAVDESTKAIIKQSLGLSSEDSIKLEYTGHAGAQISSDSASSGLEDVYVTPEEARVQNVTTSQNLKSRFSRKNRTKDASHVSAMDKLKSKLHGH